MSLLELLIVVVIIGVLAAIAYPSYRDYVTRAKRNEARAALLQIATNQERYYLQENTYTEDLTEFGFAAANNVPTETGTYLIDISGADANDFTATATYRDGGIEAEKCLTFTIDGRGTKTSAPLADCWTRSR